MGVWTSVEGTCSGFERQKVSLKKLLNDFFGGEDWSLGCTETEDSKGVSVYILYEQSGRKAFETFDRLCDELAESGITFDLSVTIRIKS